MYINDESYRVGWRAVDRAASGAYGSYTREQAQELVDELNANIELQIVYFVVPPTVSKCGKTLKK